jgi:hypothetical protein
MIEQGDIVLNTPATEGRRRLLPAEVHTAMATTQKLPAGPVVWLDHFNAVDAKEITALARRIARSEELDATGLLRELEAALKAPVYLAGGVKRREVDAAWDRLKAFRAALKADPEEAQRFADVVLAREEVRRR